MYIFNMIGFICPAGKMVSSLKIAMCQERGSYLYITVPFEHQRHILPIPF